MFDSMTCKLRRAELIDSSYFESSVSFNCINWIALNCFSDCWRPILHARYEYSKKRPKSFESMSTIRLSQKTYLRKIDKTLNISSRVVYDQFYSWNFIRENYIILSCRNTYISQNFCGNNFCDASSHLMFIINNSM